MKFDHHLATYLYMNKNLKLEGIGTFTLDGLVSVPNELDKEIYYPIEGLSFECFPKSETDENLIKFLVERLGKIQPLVRSDLESYLSNIKQFINLGKPYTIEGIGTLSKNNKGVYEFTPGNFLPVKEELNPKRENEEHNYPVRSGISTSRVLVVILVIIALLAVLGGIGWGVSSLINNYKKNEATTDEPTVEANQQGNGDTLTQQNMDTLAGNNNLPSKENTNDTGWYKMAFEVYRFKERAKSRALQLQHFGTPVKMDTIVVRDSLRYRLYLPMRIKHSDTTRVKDSLSILLGEKVFIPRYPGYRSKTAITPKSTPQQ